MSKKEGIKQVRVAELFGGVGGFRVGLNKVKAIKKDGQAKEKRYFQFVFFNQWEPCSRSQFAYKCYEKRFGKKTHVMINENIEDVSKKIIPDHDLLVAGFPCQDYSVARTLNGERGIKGKKGVLWWQIYETLKEKKTNFILLENVDRLLISPSNQPGRDFAVMLKCLETLNYAVEWKVINAADYRMPQKRKRIFIFAFKKTTKYFSDNYKKIRNNKDEIFNNLFLNKGLLRSNFKNEKNCEKTVYKNKKYELSKFEIETISNDFSGTFFNNGIMIDGNIYTSKLTSKRELNEKNLRSVILPDDEICNECYINDKKVIDKLSYLKGSKSITRIKNGYKYLYKEGKMIFPDTLDRPGRTMLTSEGTINRSTHVIESEKGLRYLDPKECELLNMFPKDWTNIEDISNKQRRFLMGNSLVCGIIERLSDDLYKIISEEDSNDS